MHTYVDSMSENWQYLDDLKKVKSNLRSSIIFGIVVHYEQHLDWLNIHKLPQRRRFGSPLKTYFIK